MALLVSHLEASESPRLISLVTLSRGPLWSPQAAKEVLPYSLVSFPLQLIENATWLLTHRLDGASSGYNSLPLWCHYDEDCPQPCEHCVPRGQNADEDPAFTWRCYQFLLR